MRTVPNVTYQSFAVISGHGVVVVNTGIKEQISYYYESLAFLVFYGNEICLYIFSFFNIKMKLLEVIIDPRNFTDELLPKFQLLDRGHAYNHTRSSDQIFNA